MLHLADEGFEQISVEPVVADPKEPYAIQPEDIPQICEGYDILAKEMLARKKQGKGFNFFHYMIDLRSMCLQTFVRMWFRNRIFSGYTVGRFVSLSSVRG